MSTPLEQNTATMEAILAAVNNLPSGGGGGSGSGSVETCTVHIIAVADYTSIGYIYYTNADGQLTTVECSMYQTYDFTVEVPKGIIFFKDFFAAGSMAYITTGGDVSTIGGYSNAYAFMVTGDGSISTV